MVYFIADNILTPLGFNSNQNFEALRHGKTGIKLIIDQKILHEPFQASKIEDAKLDESFSKLGSNLSFTRLEKMLIISINEALEKANIEISSPKTLIILSTTKGNIDLLEQEKKKQFEPERIMLWRLGQVIGTFFGNPNAVVVLSNACISGVLAINTAAMMISNGNYENVVVAGGDLLSRFVVSGFMSFLSLSNKPCKPFDAQRDGLSLGEGAGTIIMSNQKRSPSSIFFAGGASANDANHISGPSRTGEGLFIAIKKTLEESGMVENLIDHISTHGTATLYNDEMESFAISRHNLQQIPVNSFKGSWGHTLGAAGVIETAALLAEMRNNIILKTTGFNSLGVSNQINVVKETQNVKLNTCLKLASGFGGSNAAILLQKN